MTIENGGAESLTTGSPIAAPLKKTTFSGSYEPALTDQNLEEVWVGSQPVNWRNEIGSLRSQQPAGHKWDSSYRAIEASGGQTGNPFEYQNNARTGVKWAVDGATGKVNIGGTLTAPLYLLGAQDPVPTGIPANSILARKQSSSGTALLQYDAAGLTNGATVTTSTVGTGDTRAPIAVDSAWTIVTGSGPTYPRLHGVQAASTAGDISWGGFAAATALGIRFMYSPSSIGSSSNILLQGTDGSFANAWRIDQAGTGGASHLRLRNAAATQVAEGAYTLVGGTPYWVQVTFTTTRIDVTLYDASGNQLDTLGATDTYGATTNLRFGPALTSPTTPALDIAHILVIGSATQPGLPLDSTAPTALTWWDGTTETALIPTTPTIPPTLARWSLAGALSVANGALRMPIDVNSTIIRIRAKVNTAPTGATLNMRLNKNGTSVATFSIATGQNSTTNTVSISCAADDYLTVDITQVGSTVAGSDLVVSVAMQAT